eukprot:scaffold89242_cov20-Prasinocladus_malaysianus.AAC.1
MKFRCNRIYYLVAANPRCSPWFKDLIMNALELPRIKVNVDLKAKENEGSSSTPCAAPRLRYRQSL